jgi:uncharacterized membrane protein HdeD (DUF308 family)
MATEGSPLGTAKRFTGWYIVAAILFIILGMFAIIEPTVAGLGVAILVGWLLVFGGIAHFVMAFQGGSAKRVTYQVILGIVFLLAGVYMLMNPVLTLHTLTLVLAGVIFIAGIFEFIGYFQIEQASGWLLVNGIAAVVVGVLIWIHWPSSSVWAIGTLVGINLLFTGVARLMMGIAGRRIIGRVDRVVSR